MVCSTTLWIMPLGLKMAPPRGHIFYIGLYREKHRKIFLSETIRLRALIFGFASPSGPLPSLFKLCPRAKMASRQGRQGHGQLSTDTYM